MIISFPRRFTNIAVAVVLLVGFGAVIIFGLNMVGADTVLPGYATAHLHLEVTVCEKSSVPIKAQFFPSAGRKYYFKDRTFEVSKGLNTIEWYIRKIPGGYYNFQVSSVYGSVLPSDGNVTLVNDKSTDIAKFSLVICTPSQPTQEVLQDEPGTVSPTATESVPSIPAPDLNNPGDDLGDLPV